MSKRPRSHQLEDKSIDVFRTHRPDHWLIREKEKDYGTDLEVEIFDENSDESTGYIFYIQAKATDDLKYEKKVSIKLDRLKYLKSFEVPSIILRYCNSSGNLFWIWTSNAVSQIKDYEAETVSVRFTSDNIWKESSYKDIERTLKFYRLLKVPSSHQRVGLALDTDGLSVSDTFELKRVVSTIVDSTPLFNSETDPDKCLPLQLTVKNENLAISIDAISSVSMKIDKVNRSDILTQILYSLAFILSRFSFNTQVCQVVKLILDEKLKLHDREVVINIAIACVENSKLVEEFVHLNEIHAKQDPAYAMYVSQLMGGDYSSEEKKESGLFSALLSDSRFSNRT